MAKILVVSGEGQVGRELIGFSDDIEYTDHRKGSPEYLAVEDERAVQRCIDTHSPDVIINAAAATNVDRCEEEHAMAYNTNGIAVKNIVNAARKSEIRLIHISTDYVFDGTTGNYSERDYPNPINYYGFSKLVGDLYADSYDNSLIVRTSGVYGNSMNFPYYIVKRIKMREQIGIIAGFYSPIHAKNLAKAIFRLSNTDVRGIVNVAGDRISRMEFARKVAKVFDLDENLLVEIKEIETMKAKRPYDTSLNLTKSKELLDFDFHSIDSNLRYFIDSYDRIV